jgi:Zn-dependent protease
VHGIDLKLDMSVVLIFVLIVSSLGASVIPSWHPDWSAPLVWGVAVAAGVAFFASLLTHELAHSLVAQRHGITVPRITLFLFGGMAEMSAEPASPRAEFFIAVVGPIASFAIGAVCIFCGLWLAGQAFLDALTLHRDQDLALLGPLATVLVWLGPVNIALALFNLVPGFPLDGGRVLRALIWWIGGDQLRATRWAANVGRFFAWSLMSLGVINLLWGRTIDGVWLLFIGWFLANAARMSYTQLLLQRTLAGLSVDQLMRPGVESVGGDVPLDEFVDNVLLRSAQGLWPVVDGGERVGWIATADVLRDGDRSRSQRRVRDVMRPLSAVSTLAPALSGRVALEHLSSLADEPTPVVSNGRVVGLLHGADVLRWIQLHRLHEPV